MSTETLGITKVAGRWVHSGCSTADNVAYTFPFGTHKGAAEYCKYCMSVYSKNGGGAISTSGLKK